MKICLKYIPDRTYTLKIYDIVIQYKEMVFFKHIPHIAYTLKIYDIIVQNKEKFV